MMLTLGLAPALALAMRLATGWRRWLRSASAASLTLVALGLALALARAPWRLDHLWPATGDERPALAASVRHRHADVDNGPTQGPCCRPLRTDTCVEMRHEA